MPNGATLRTAIANMRKDQTGTYHLLMRVFGPAIVTSSHIKNAIMNGTEWTTAVTDSDEAFLLLALLNGWNTWAPENLKIDNENWPKSSPKWSDAGRGGNWTKFCGWKRAAIKEYAALVRAVRQDRLDVESNINFNARMREVIILTLSKECQRKLENGTNIRTTTCTDGMEASELDEFMEDIE